MSRACSIQKTGDELSDICKKYFTFRKTKTVWFFLYGSRNVYDCGDMQSDSTNQI